MYSLMTIYKFTPAYNDLVNVFDSSIHVQKLIGKTNYILNIRIFS